MTSDTTRRRLLRGVAACGITSTIIPFPAAVPLAQEQAQREAVRILRALPKRYRLPWVTMGERLADGMPPTMAKALCNIERDLADLAAGFENPGVAS